MSKGFEFGILPALLMMDTRVSPTAKLVFAALKSFDGYDSIYPSIATIRERSGLAERTVQLAIHELEHYCYLTVHRNTGRGNTNVYVLDETGEKGRKVCTFSRAKRRVVGQKWTRIRAKIEAKRVHHALLKGAARVEKGANGAPETEKSFKTEKGLEAEKVPSLPQKNEDQTPKTKPGPSGNAKLIAKTLLAHMVERKIAPNDAPVDQWAADADAMMQVEGYRYEVLCSRISRAFSGKPENWPTSMKAVREMMAAKDGKPTSTARGA